jgi:uncharacterized membrane protein YdfJ with MMPL/SSD domain
MKHGLAIASLAAVIVFAMILFKVSLGGIAPVAILAVVFVGLLVARKLASSGARG